MPGSGRLRGAGRRLAAAFLLGAAGLAGVPGPTGAAGPSGIPGAAGTLGAPGTPGAASPRDTVREPARDPALFRISSIDAGILAFDLSIVELKREPRVSELRVHGFNARTEPGSRWLMCMFNTLAILRGFDYWTAVYPAGDDEIVLVGFPPGPRDKMADLDPRFASRWAMGVVAPIDRGVRLCKRGGA